MRFHGILLLTCVLLINSVFGQSRWFSLNAGRFLVDDGEGFDLDHELGQSQFVDPDERIGR